MIQIGKELVESGLLSDGLDFLIKADARDELNGLIHKVIRDGDYFLWGRINKALGRPTDKEELKSLMEHAERLGKEAFARHAGETLAPPADPSNS